MVSGSKLKNPSKVSGDSPISLYYSLIYGNCLGNVVMGMEKCGKMCENVLETRFLYTTTGHHLILPISRNDQFVIFNAKMRRLWLVAT